MRIKTEAPDWFTKKKKESQNRTSEVPFGNFSFPVILPVSNDTYLDPILNKPYTMNSNAAQHPKSLLPSSTPVKNLSANFMNLNKIPNSNVRRSLFAGKPKHQKSELELQKIDDFKKAFQEKAAIKGRIIADEAYGHLKQALESNPQSFTNFNQYVSKLNCISKEHSSEILKNLIESVPYLREYLKNNKFINYNGSKKNFKQELVKFSTQKSLNFITNMTVQMKDKPYIKRQVLQWISEIDLKNKETYKQLVHKIKFKLRRYPQLSAEFQSFLLEADFLNPGNISMKTAQHVYLNAPKSKKAQRPGICVVDLTK